MTRARRVVSDTGPLITLEKLPDGFGLIRQLYGEILIPPSVLAELAEGQQDAPEEYLARCGIEDLVRIGHPSSSGELPEARRLHRGETDAILLARDLRLPLLIEETVGRRVAQRLGLSISGIAGQLVRAYRDGLLDRPAAEFHLGELLRAGRINRRIFEELRKRL